MAHPIGLDEATHLEGDDGRFSVRLSDAWEIWGPSDGYLAAIVLRAAGRPDAGRSADLQVLEQPQLPPPELGRGDHGAGYTAPNLDIGVCFHQFATRGEWLLVDHECPIATDGLLGVSGRVRGADGRLLATGNAQLCCIPHGKG
jgi:hypothetical protein